MVINSFQFSSVAHLCLTLRPHGLNHTRLPCPTLTPEACSNSCPLSWWCHPTISFSVIPFSSCLQSYPTSGSFSMSQLFTSGDQSIGASASTSGLPMNEYSGLTSFRIDWFDLVVQWLSRVFSSRIQVDWAFGNLGDFIMLPGWEVQSGGRLCLMESQHPCCHL